MASIQKYFIESENIGVYEQIFESAAIIDAHAHLGVDVDGHKLGVKEMLKNLKVNDVNKTVIFPLNDPRAGTDFSYPNERILKAYKEHPSKFIPFFRINPNYDWTAEFNKRVSQGFLGVKLHPRGQAFRIASPSAMKVYEAIEKNNLMLLIHGGFDVPKLAHDLLNVVRKFKNLKLIIGHGGFSDLDMVIELFGERPNVLFDTSAMRFLDLVQLLKGVNYKKVVFGSDIPYYERTLSLQMLVDSATLTSHSPNQIKSMLGGNIERWLK